jgi:AAA+ ATPase superfamily predicted ATPase
MILTGNLRSLRRVLKGIPINVLVGTRRTGRTSLLNVALNELGNPYIYLDLRRSVPPYKIFMDALEDS